MNTLCWNWDQVAFKRDLLTKASGVVRQQITEYDVIMSAILQSGLPDAATFEIKKLMTEAENSSSLDSELGIHTLIAKVFSNLDGTGALSQPPQDGLALNTSQAAPGESQMYKNMHKLVFPVGSCNRCGKMGHHKDKCYANKDVFGN